MKLIASTDPVHTGSRDESLTKGGPRGYQLVQILDLQRFISENIKQYLPIMKISFTL